MKLGHHVPGTAEGRLRPRPGADQRPHDDGHGEFAHVAIGNGGSQSWSSVTEGANITIDTGFASQPPASTAAFGAGVVNSGAPRALAFTFGDTFATPCIEPTFFPGGDGPEDHCL